MIERRMKISPEKRISGLSAVASCLVLLYDGFVTSVPGHWPGNYTPSEALRLGHPPRPAFPSGFSCLSGLF
jgi:hypothetical protein